jgi:hypothetical protein
MDKTIQEELKAHLMQTNETFRSLNDQHHEYDVLVEKLESKPRSQPKRKSRSTV